MWGVHIAGDTTPMAWKPNYAYIVYDTNAANPAAGNLVKDGFALASEPTTGVVETNTITSLTRANSEALSFCRKFESVGIDAAALVYMKPVGTDEAAGTPLPDGAKPQQVISQLGVVPRDLRHAMAEASRKAATSTGAAFGTDYDVDVNQTPPVE